MADLAGSVEEERHVPETDDQSSSGAYSTLSCLAHIAAQFMECESPAQVLSPGRARAPAPPIIPIKQ